MKTNDAYMPDNVFRYVLGKDVDRVQTPLRVMSMLTNESLTVNAIWDTGSTFSSVSHSVVSRLGLTDDGMGVGVGAGGMMTGRTSICFAFPGNTRWAAMVEAAQLPDVPGVPDFIIGLDIITLGDFRLTREADQNVLCFTFDKEVFIDFGNDSPETTIRKMEYFKYRLQKAYKQENKE